MKLKIGKQRLEDDIVKRRKKTSHRLKENMCQTRLIKDLYLKCMKKFKTRQ